MRIREGEFAYDLEPVRDPATQIQKGWTYRIFRVYPSEVVLEKGEAPTREAAEAEAHKLLARHKKRDRHAA